MDYKEYSIEDNELVELSKLKVGFIPKEDFIKIHQNSIIVTVDILIWYNSGFLLVQRDNVPANGELWNIGGRIERGVSLEESVRKKVKSECNLSLKNMKNLGVSRSLWKTDPFGHGKGTDTLTFMYLAEGVGELKLDKLHSNPLIVDKKKFEEIKHSFHPFMSDFFEIAFKDKWFLNLNE
ncbi:MAG: NUDIX domain-containing protein [Nanoarchaeota archaeon]